jgi:hypothetical protein
MYMCVGERGQAGGMEPSCLSFYYEFQTPVSTLTLTLFRFIIHSRICS